MTAACVTVSCGSTDTHPYLNGAHCDQHAPWAVAGHKDPRTQIDPARTDAAMRIAATPMFAIGGTDLNKQRPGGYKSRQAAIKEAAQRDASSTLQHPERTTA